MKKKAPAKTVGTVYPKGSMFLRLHCGEANLGMTNFELATWVNTGSPLVYCELTGKTFSLSWQDILELAIKAGVATP